MFQQNSQTLSKTQRNQMASFASKTVWYQYFRLHQIKAKYYSKQQAGPIGLFKRK